MKLLLILAVLLTGCTRVFVKEDGSPLALQDKRECEYEAMKATGSSGRYFSLTSPSAMGSGAMLEEKCLELRGYHATYK